MDADPTVKLEKIKSMLLQKLLAFININFCLLKDPQSKSLY